MSLSQKCYYCRHYVYGNEEAVDIEIHDPIAIERYGGIALAHVSCLNSNNAPLLPSRNSDISIEISDDNAHIENAYIGARFETIQNDYAKDTNDNN